MEWWREARAQSGRAGADPRCPPSSASWENSSGENGPGVPGKNRHPPVSFKTPKTSSHSFEEWLKNRAVQAVPFFPFFPLGKRLRRFPLSHRSGGG
jgi:hypothetical protein